MMKSYLQACLVVFLAHFIEFLMMGGELLLMYLAGRVFRLW